MKKEEDEVGLAAIAAFDRLVGAANPVCLGSRAMRLPRAPQRRRNGPTLPPGPQREVAVTSTCDVPYCKTETSRHAARRPCSSQRHDFRRLQDVVASKSDSTKSSCCPAPVFIATA
ncbi:hypothetical protein MTO96_033408 [Rhipicephalus appendiculatus]